MITRKGPDDMAKVDDRWYAKLECHHIIHGSGTDKVLDSKFCHSCRNYRAVIALEYGRGYWFRCQQCRWMRAYGVGLLSRDTMGTAHAIRKAHTVWFFYNDEEEYVVDHSHREIVQAELPFVEEYPF